MLTAILEDTFSGKAEGTLLKRSTDFCKFGAWIVQQRGRPLAPTESQVYGYLTHLRNSGASATAGESFLKSYRFIAHLTGAAHPKISARSAGASKVLAKQKRPLWQAPPLTVQAVSALEGFCHDSTDSLQVVVAGFCLFCIYASARWSDAARGHGMSEDLSASGFLLLESGTLHYKTNARDRKDAILPLIAIGTGLVKPPWGSAWMKHRAKLKLDDMQCVMPAVTASGNFLKRHMCAAEGTLWLREILHLQGVTGNLEAYTSHSLKATALSWTAKSCSMSYEQRLTQGHHVSPKHGMALLYSRDALTEILVQVARVVNAISQGVLAPDLPRAERVAQALQDDPGKFAHLAETVPENLPEDEPWTRTTPKPAPICPRRLTWE